MRRLSIIYPIERTTSEKDANVDDNTDDFFLIYNEFGLNKLVTSDELSPCIVLYHGVCTNKDSNLNSKFYLSSH